MTPLDLRSAPPRAPRAELAGIVFLPRSIDKARASLAGGSLGAYKIEGLTETMLEHLGIAFAAFSQCVRTVSSDDEVAAFVTSHAVPGGVAKWTDFVMRREPAGGDRVAAKTRFPWLDERPDLVLALDVIAEDDLRHFAKS